MKKPDRYIRSDLVLKKTGLEEIKSTYYYADKMDEYIEWLEGVYEKKIEN